jgi:hypothetical protein
MSKIRIFAVFASFGTLFPSVMISPPLIIISLSDVTYWLSDHRQLRGKPSQKMFMFGKPQPQPYRAAMKELRVTAATFAGAVVVMRLVPIVLHAVGIQTE